MDPVTARFAESPVVFGRDQSLIGITCRPYASADPTRPFVIFLNAGIIHRSGPGRMTVHLARALARAGVPSLRFDLTGVGDSVVPAGAAAMAIQDRVRIDIDDAMAFARTQCGASTFVLSGLCSGADNALRTAARCDAVVGLALLDLNVPPTRGYYRRYYARRLLRRETWANVITGRHPTVAALLRRAGLSPRAAVGSPTPVAPSQADGPDPSLEHDAVVPPSVMREMLRGLVARDAQLLFVFSAGRETQYNYARQFLDLFPDIDFGDRLRTPYFADADHMFTGPDLQTRLCATVVQWFSATEFLRDAAPAPRAVPVPAPHPAPAPRAQPDPRGMQPTSGWSGSGRGP